MAALSEWIRDELRAHVRDMSSFQATDFVWTWADVSFQPTAGMIAESALTPQRKALLTCTHRDDSSVEFRVLAAQRGNSHEYDLLCEYQPALMFTIAQVEIDDPAQIKRPLTEWLGIVARQQAPPTMSRRVDELVERVADKLKSYDEPYSEPRRERIISRLQQVAAYAIVLREGIEDDVAQRTSLTDAQKDAKYLSENLPQMRRGRAMRWILGIIARVDLAWQQKTGTPDEANEMLQNLWEAADFAGALGEDYRTRARLDGGDR